MLRTRSLLRPVLAALVVAGAAAAVVAAVPAISGRAADHLDSPNVKKDGRTDINDVFVFHPVNAVTKAQSMHQTVLAMTINPAAGVISGTTFDPDARYEFAIDTTGDAVEDIIYRIRAIGSVAIASRVDGTRDVPLAMARLDQVDSNAGIGQQNFQVKLFAGLRDDPFSFDLNAFNAGAKFCQGTGGTGSDFFKGFNASVIVLQVPTTDIKNGAVGVWARTMVRDAAGEWKQVDRMGRPAINTVFIPDNPFEPTEPTMEDSFNTSNPRDDRTKFRAEVVDSLTVLFSLNDATDDKTDDAAKISGLADVLLPDLLTADLSQASGFLNGRDLADDVIDAELNLITEGAVKTDCVPVDSAFLAAFPYLAEKN